MARMGGGEECPAFDSAFAKWNYYYLPVFHRRVRNPAEIADAKLLRALGTVTEPGNNVSPVETLRLLTASLLAWSQGNQDNYSFGTTDTATLSQTPVIPVPGWGRHCLSTDVRPLCLHLKEHTAPPKSD